MSESNIENVAMIGAGTLGGQIAWHSAYMGKQVTVYDISAKRVSKNVRPRRRATPLSTQLI